MTDSLSKSLRRHAKDHPTLAADAYKLAQACNKESDLWAAVVKACKGADRKEAE